MKFVVKANDDKPAKLNGKHVSSLCRARNHRGIYRVIFNEGESNECYAAVCKKFKELCEEARNVIYERLVNLEI